MRKNGQKICLVTGANSGIGKEIAIGLAKSGAHVIIVCRSLHKGQAALEEIKAAADSTSVDLLIADLSSQTEIRSLAKTICERYPALHVLVNNAGVVLAKKMLSVDGIEMTLATNCLGPLLLTLSLQNLLEKSAPSRVINISSASHKWVKVDLTDLQYENRKYHFMKVYAQSKLVVNMMTFKLAQKFAGTGVVVNCIHPGAVRTALGSGNAQGVVLKFIDKLIKFFFLTPKQAAKPIIDLAISPQWEKVTGEYFERGKPAKSSVDTHDKALAERVWEINTKLVGL